MRRWRGAWVSLAFLAGDPVRRQGRLWSRSVVEQSWGWISERQETVVVIGGAVGGLDRVGIGGVSGGGGLDQDGAGGVSGGGGGLH